MAYHNFVHAGVTSALYLCGSRIPFGWTYQMSDRRLSPRDENKQTCERNDVISVRENTLLLHSTNFAHCGVPVPLDGSMRISTTLVEYLMAALWTHMTGISQSEEAIRFMQVRRPSTSSHLPIRITSNIALLSSRSCLILSRASTPLEAREVRHPAFLSWRLMMRLVSECIIFDG